MAAPEKAAKTKAAAPLVKTSPAIALQAKALSTDWACGPFGVCAGHDGDGVRPPVGVQDGGGGAAALRKFCPLDEGGGLHLSLPRAS